MPGPNPHNRQKVRNLSHVFCNPPAPASSLPGHFSHAGTQHLARERRFDQQRIPDIHYNNNRRPATLHRLSQPLLGLPQDNYMGALPQDNTPSIEWSDFFLRRRLEPRVRMACGQPPCGRPWAVANLYPLLIHLNLFGQWPSAAPLERRSGTVQHFTHNSWLLICVKTYIRPYARRPPGGCARKLISG